MEVGCHLHVPVLFPRGNVPPPPQWSQFHWRWKGPASVGNQNFCRLPKIAIRSLNLRSKLKLHCLLGIIYFVCGYRRSQFSTWPRPALDSPSLLSNGYCGLYPWGKSDWSVKMTTHLQLVTSLTKSGSMEPLPPYVFRIQCAVN
jgi:hypothetical protein